MRRIVFLLLLLSTGVNAQKSHITKLLRELKETSPDTSKVNLYYSLSRIYWNTNLDSVLLMATKGIDLADSIGFKKGRALNCLSMGVGLAGQGNYPGAIKYYLECLKLSEELNLEGLSGNVYGNIAIAYVEHGHLKNAIEYFNKALRIAEKYGEAATCEPLINLSDLHTQTGEYNLARTYATRALAISRTQGDSTYLAVALFNISEIYRATHHNDSARLYLQESARISRRIRDYHGVSHCLNSLAEIVMNEGKFNEAIALANQSLHNLQRVRFKAIVNMWS